MRVRATLAERAEPRPGDDLVAPADVVMDRGFTVEAPPEAVWPWLAQLGKRRAGWYLPRRVERLLPPRRRALRRLDPRWTNLRVGDVIPDYGGRDETFEVAAVDPPRSLVYTSRRGHTLVSWSITLRPAGSGTRVLLRLRLAPVRHRRLAETLGEFFDFATIAGMAAGLRERLK
ncbi:SRPBCC family protein [Kutzneria buriramensis]|uniref:Polyketide cyclase/dehydrase/lipid transport protein n=1 Tax=Kutzneria buriramensis TaxID=1045776 RepID=A0A3E0H6P4_9PSEU|nr:SRPBCC family protein [Kutzneria buriramensis]REH39153.1 polyketide cyclase/dehydrase/lipid transport protein [Kutzneria buriramensis]